MPISRARYFLVACFCSTARALAATNTVRAVAQDLCRWVDANGGSASNVVAGPTQHGLGLLCAGDVAQGDVVVHIPRELTLAAIHVSDDIQALQSNIPSEFWSARLALLLLAERSQGSSSRLAPYLPTLPAAFSTPLFWDPRALQHLQYPTVQAPLLKTAKFIQGFAAEHLGARSASAFSGLEVGPDAFGWAVAACSSRAFRVGGNERVLCPVIDLGNHAPKGEANTELRGTLGGAVELVACRPIRLGEEVTYCYGELSNDAFLLDYGFVPADNVHDFVQLAWGCGDLLSAAAATAGVKRSETLLPWQHAALRARLPASRECVRVTPRGVDPDALAACRIAAASDATALRKTDGGARALPPAGEVAAQKMAAAMCALALTSLPEATDASNEASGGNEGSAVAEGGDGGVALARQFMEGKRQLCSLAVQHTGERIKALQNGEAKAELRGTAQKKKSKGVRKPSARSEAVRPRTASGFGNAGSGTGTRNRK